MAGDQRDDLTSLGIFLGYEKNIPLRNEGLGRLLGYVVKGWCSSEGNPITIACPYWLESDVRMLLDDHQVASGAYRVLATKRPVLLRISQATYSGMRKLSVFAKEVKTSIRRRMGKEKARLPTDRRRGGEEDKALVRKLVNARHRLVDNLRSSKGVAEFLCNLVILFVVMLVAVLVGVTVVVLALPVALALILRKTIKKKRRKYLAKRSVKGKKPRQNKVSRRTLRELDELVELVNQQKSVSLWLIPTPFWPEGNRIEGRTAVVCPDLVLHEFPTQFSDPGIAPIYNRILGSLQGAERLITYSDYTRRAQLIESVGIPECRIRVVPHGRADLSTYLKLGRATLPYAEQREVAFELLRGYQVSTLWSVPYWNDVRFDMTSYVFYSSQYRPYKNIYSLVRAIDHLRRTTSDAPRLVLTCKRNPDSEIARYITSRGLEAFVLFANNIPSEMLAALNCLAKLSVNPSLFEGGFPFTFSEAYSVGTPSVMSKIPVVTEVIRDVQLQKTMLFDPYDYRSMAQRISWGIQHREELLAHQRPVYEAMPTWNSVSQAYAEAIAN